MPTASRSFLYAFFRAPTLGPSSAAMLLRNRKKNMVAVVHTASTSATGSARNTAKDLSAKKWGRIKIRGMSRMIFRRAARNSEVLALPKATKVCWQATCTPKIPVAAM